MNESTPRNGATLLRAAPDWLTITAATDEHREALSEWAHHRVRQQRDLGNDVKPMRMLGYDGVSTRHVAVGHRDDSTMLRLSGPFCADHWREVVDYADNCSRIDLACTAKLTQKRIDLVPIMYGLACREAERRGGKLTVSAITSNQNSGTLYLGSRKSDLFGRLYDKATESRDPAYQDCWRWEVEYKNKYAKHVLDALANDARAEATIAATVHQYWTERGVPPWWDRRSEGVIKKLPTEQTDDERRIAWLAEQVRPAVTELMARRDHAEILGALGVMWDEPAAHV